MVEVAWHHGREPSRCPLAGVPDNADVATHLVPHTTRGRWLALTACLTLPGLIAGVSSLLGLSQMVGIVALLLGVIASSQLVWTSWSQVSGKLRAVAVAAATAGILFTAAMLIAPRLLYAAQFGEPMTVTIGAEHSQQMPTRTGTRTEYCYDIQGDDGTQLPQQLCTGARRLDTGDRIAALVDPSGVVPPATVTETTGTGTLWFLALGALVATLALCRVSAGQPWPGRVTDQDSHPNSGPPPGVLPQGRRRRRRSRRHR